MAKFILGKKIGMTTVYDKERGALNVTLVECVPNKISLLRSEEKDGYEAIQLSVEAGKKKTFKRELRVVNGSADVKEGEEVTVDKFEVDEKVDVSGISKSKGFQGVMKRHGFHGAPSTHGHRHDHRAPGSIGPGYPQHVLKGRRMAGRMGGIGSTTKNVKVAYIDKESNLIGLKGPVPGVNGRMVKIFVK